MDLLLYILTTIKLLKTKLFNNNTEKYNYSTKL